LNILPNGLSPNQKNSFFIVVPNQGDQISFVNQWQVDANTVTVAVTYSSFPTQTAVFLAVNGQLLANSYSSIGYTADQSSFVSASINVGLSPAPVTLVVPASAVSSPGASLG
jgi:hypothetical protein